MRVFACLSDLHVCPAISSRLRVKVDAIYRDEKECQSARTGENLRLRLSGCEETDISPGFVLSSIKNPVPMVTQFEAQLVRPAGGMGVLATTRFTRGPADDGRMAGRENPRTAGRGGL
jgi:hypothetical protein